MGKRKIPGLQKRFGVWQIDKRVCGRRICESTGTSSLEEAERYLVKRIEEIRQQTLFGVRKKRTFEEAAAKYVLENQHKASIDSDIGRLKFLMPHIGHLYLDAIHMGALDKFISTSKKRGNKVATINHGLQVVRRILNLAAYEWCDECGLTWILHPPKIKLQRNTDARKPYPLSWDEQDRLFNELPVHLANMALFAVNTGCRDAVVCGLRWEWEVRLDEKQTVFVVPGEFVKNREDRLIVLNRIAQSLIESVRGQHDRHVFTFRNNETKHII
jgi:integrase